MDIEKIKEGLLYVSEHYADRDGDQLASMIETLKDKVNEIIDVLNSRRVMGQK
ncbi:hypothetical protein ES705_05315 [subsurface metagenome]